jgi:hypothetical protein
MQFTILALATLLTVCYSLVLIAKAFYWVERTKWIKGRSNLYDEDRYGEDN